MFHHTDIHKQSVSVLESCIHTPVFSLQSLMGVSDHHCMKEQHCLGLLTFLLPTLTQAQITYSVYLIPACWLIQLASISPSEYAIIKGAMCAVVRGLAHRW